MDAPNPSAQLTLANRAPLHIGSYALRVRDLPRVADFYRQTVGFETIAQDARRVVLGNAGVPLLALEQRDGLVLDDKTQAGLFHTAFILPSRAELARWYVHAKRLGLDIPRTGDHLVNEAIYYDDPEGNGCECYADRAAETWEWDADGQCNIDTGKKVDLDALASEADDDGTGWQPPAAMRIGHINLRVGDYPAAEDFYSKVIGLDWTGRRHINFAGQTDRTITFMSSGRYHHHFAANDFTAQGAGARDADHAGLASFTFEHDDRIDTDALKGRLRAAGAPVETTGDGFETRDPWGTMVKFARG